MGHNGPTGLGLYRAPYRVSLQEENQEEKKTKKTWQMSCAHPWIYFKEVLALFLNFVAAEMNPKQINI